MQIQVCNHSSYPIADPGRSALAQAELGLDWVTVCPTGAGDSITGLAASLAGARLGEGRPAAFSARPPHRLRIQARLRYRNTAPTDGSVAASCRTAAAETTTPLKLAITGPYTLSRLATIETTAYRDLDHLAEDLANHLADLVREAIAAGVRMVQVDEPALLAAPQDVRLVRETLEPFQDAVETRALLSVATYGGPVGELFAQLNSLPGAVVALDCASSPGTLDDLAATGSGKPLALGLLSGSETIAAETIARRIEKALRRYVHDVVYLQPAIGLESIPEAAARDVLITLQQARDLVIGGRAD